VHVKAKSVPWALGILSAATLALEINLTRLFAVAQFYHFAFMIVSLALLGFGASGTLLTLFPRLRARDPVHGLVWAGWSFAITALGAHWLTIRLPFDSFRLTLDWRQWGILALHYLCLSAPFLCSGWAVGHLLAANPEKSNRVYAANMTGSAVGCLLAMALPSWVGGEGVVVIAAALGIGAALVGTWHAARPPVCHWVRLVHIVAVMLLILAALRIPPFLAIGLSPYKALSYALQVPGAERILQQWNALSRVDVVQSSSIRSLPSSSFLCAHPPPAQLGLTVDGDNLSPISHVTPGFNELPFTDCLLTALPYRLRPGAEALVLEPGGGFDVLVALGEGARQVTAVVSNPLIVHAVREQGDWAGNLYDDPRVRLVTQNGRSYIRRAETQYDAIDLALTGSQRPIASGAYSLAEDDAHTVEAFVDDLKRLKGDGLLAVTRWLQVPPSESVRAFALAVEAVERTGGNPKSDIAALRSYRQMLILVQRSAYTPGELEAIRAFAEERRFDLVYLPDLQPDEINRYNILPEPIYHETYSALLQAEDRQAWYRGYPSDVRPPTDDRPFYGHYFRWRQVPEVLAAAGHTWQPFGGAGFLVPLALLILATLAAGTIILLPLVLKRSPLSTGRSGWQIGLYFALLGLGYLCVEIPLMQRFILYLGHPTWSMSTVLFSILVFSGIGSRFSHRVPLRTALVAIPVLVVGYILVLPRLLEWTIVLPLWARLLVSTALLAPLGTLMGMPFPRGLSRLEDAPLVTWAWASNGALSVIASILAALVALSWGFSAVLVLGAGCYLAAIAARPRYPAR